MDDEPGAGVVLEHTLTQIGHRTVVATSIEEGLAAFGRESFDLILSEYQPPGASGVDLLEELHRQGSDVPVIFMSGFANIEHAVLSMRRGAADYLTKPLRAEALRIAVSNAIEVARLRRENEDYRRELSSLRGMHAIVGEGAAVRGVMETIAAVAPTRATILLEGESGTGKELFAHALHEQSTRRDRAFVTVNCAALPEGLVESVLFGHERGAFTGAQARTLGAFERANHGTLLLDEISEMRLDLQPKLLRAIQEQEIERVGGSHPVQVDVRLVATTNRNLLAEVEAGRFRRDLYYRLNVVPIRTPPLSERIDDIPLLVQHFVASAAAGLGIKPPRVTPEMIEALKHRPWPGNIRELANTVERAVIMSRGGGLLPNVFDDAASTMLDVAHAAPSAPLQAGSIPAPSLNLKELARIAIERAMLATGGRRGHAARLLGISDRTLRNKLRIPHGS